MLTKTIWKLAEEEDPALAMVPPFRQGLRKCYVSMANYMQESSLSLQQRETYHVIFCHSQWGCHRVKSLSASRLTKRQPGANAISSIFVAPRLPGDMNVSRGQELSIVVSRVVQELRAKGNREERHLLLQSNNEVEQL